MTESDHCHALIITPVRQSTQYMNIMRSGYAAQDKGFSRISHLDRLPFLAGRGLDFKPLLFALHTACTPSSIVTFTTLSVTMLLSEIPCSGYDQGCGGKKDMTDRFKGDLTVWISSVLFALAAIMVRELSGQFSSLFISFIRFATGMVLGLGTLAVKRKPVKLRRKLDLFLRSLFGMLAMIAYYTSIQIGGSSRGTLLNTLYPLFVVIFGALLFSIPLRRKDAFSLLLAVPGIFIIFWDGSKGVLLGDLLGLFSGILGGLSVHFMKRAREENSAEIIYLGVCLFGLVPGFFTFREGLHMSLAQFGLLTLTGAVVYVAQVTITFGLKYISASRSSLLSFTKVPLTFVFAMIFLGEIPTWRFFVGSAFVLAGILILESGKRLAQSEIESKPEIEN